MEIILLEKVRNLGEIGEKVKAKAGYARNFLVPQGKALLATKENLIKFKARRAELEEIAKQSLAKAEERAKTLQNISLSIAVKVTEEGQLFGSVGIREVIEGLTKLGHNIERHEISLPNGPIHQLGEYTANLLIHSAVTVPIKIIVVAEE